MDEAVFIELKEPYKNQFRLHPDCNRDFTGEKEAANLVLVETTTFLQKVYFSATGM